MDDIAAPIVIGNDGSDFAEAALRKGLTLADRLGVPVRIVRAWTVSSAPRPETAEPGYVPPIEEFEEAVRSAFRRDVAHVIRDFPAVEVTLETPHGAAGRALVEASHGALMLVVGRRGTGGFAGLLVGSVTDHVVEHATADVLVVRNPSGDQAPGPSDITDGAWRPE